MYSNCHIAIVMVPFNTFNIIYILYIYIRIYIYTYIYIYINHIT